MAKLPGLHLSESEVYQEIDASELLGVDLSKDPLLAQSIGQAVVDYMRERTLSGKDAFGESFATYSKSYKQSQDYQFAGKSSKVNMKLRGFMLTSMDFEESSGVYRFGFDDPEENAKAYGHMTGMEGHKHLQGKTPVRFFFGISEDDFKQEIERKFGDDLKALAEDDTTAEDITGALFGQSQTQAASSTVTLDSILGDSFLDEEF